MKAVIDTSIFFSALKSREGVSRKILEIAFLGEVEPIIGDALYFEYENLLMREYLHKGCRLGSDERQAFFDDFCSVCNWVDVPEHRRAEQEELLGCRHVAELGISGGADMIITWKKEDFEREVGVIPALLVLTPLEYLNEYREELRWRL